MSKRLAPYGNENFAGSVSTIGKTKASHRLAARMPSREVLAKVGAMPGAVKAQEDRTHRLVRLRAKAG